MVIGALKDQNPIKSSSSPLDGRLRSPIEGSELLLRPEHLEGAGQVFFNAHHGSTVIELSAVVGGRKDCH